MGGYGSGKRGTRDTVESCLSIDANFYAKRGFFKPGIWHGIARWSTGGRETGSCGVLVRIEEGRASVTLQYNKQERIVPLTYYVPGFGGRRYLFLCPVCDRRVRTLHFNNVRDGVAVACRTCHNLTYTSCNESHKHDSIFKLMARGDSRFTWKDYKQAMDKLTKESRKR